MLPYTPEELKLLDTAAIAVLPTIYQAWLNPATEPHTITQVEHDSIAYYAYRVAEATVRARRQILGDGALPFPDGPGDPQPPQAPTQFVTVEPTLRARVPSSTPMMARVPRPPLTPQSPLVDFVAWLPSGFDLHRIVGNAINHTRKIDEMGVSVATPETVTIAEMLALSNEQLFDGGPTTYKLLEAMAHTLRSNGITIPPHSMLNELD